MIGHCTKFMKISKSESRSTGEPAFLKIEPLAEMSAERKCHLLLRSVTRMEEARPLIEEIMVDVQESGDDALIRYTKRFDNVSLKPENICVSKAEIRQAYKRVKAEHPGLIASMKKLMGCLRDFHEQEVSQYKFKLKAWAANIRHSSFPGKLAMRNGQLKRPIERVGIYVPGGHAVLFTTALMGVTPAKIAGVPEIVVASPPSRDGDIDPKVIVAADLAGATQIVRVGGAQAIAGLAYGTISIPKVSKIVGPGNIYVAAAKSYVASRGLCSIDFLAGPSEILVIADESAKAEWVAQDMIAQAEHDPNACALCVTNSKEVAKAVLSYIEREVANPSEGPKRLKDIAKTSLSEFGAIILVDNLDEAFDFANDFAPEHLEIMTKNPRNWLAKVQNAGAVFLGKYSPVAIGDYVCPNHILPTGGAAKYTSGINVDTFLKKPNTSKVPKELSSTLNDLVEVLSRAEGLYYEHGLSVKARVTGSKKVKIAKLK
jgi:histidinol dehydrogenase